MAQKVFDRKQFPLMKAFDAQRFHPNDLKPDPILNGRVSLPDIAKFKRDFLDPNVGQVQPITIAKVDGLPVIVDGVTRWRAAKEISDEKIGLHEGGAFFLKCQYTPAKTPLERYTLTVKANIRNEPTPEDEAHSIAIFLHTFMLDEADIASRIYGRTTMDGKPDVKWLRERNAINDLTPAAIVLLKSGKLKSKAAVALAKLTPTQQKEKLKTIADGGTLTVAAIRRQAADTAPAVAAASTPESQARKIRTVSDCRTLVQEYIDMDIPSRIAGLSCENALRTILTELLDEMK